MLSTKFSLKTVVNILTRGKKFLILKTQVLKLEHKLLTLLTLNKLCFDEKDILSISKNSIFENTSLKGIVYGIISNGKISLNE